jgi:arginase family enzyme
LCVLVDPASAVRPIVCDWDASSRRSGTSENSTLWKDLLDGLDDACLPAIFLTRRLGDIILPALRALVSLTMAAGERPLILGGDHRLTHSVLQTVSTRYNHLIVHQFDAHHDAHASPTLSNFSMMRFVNDSLKLAVVRHGCREPSPDVPTVDDPQPSVAYVSIDADFFDPMVFAAVSFPLKSDAEKETLTLDALRVTLDAVCVPIIGADIVEVRGGDVKAADVAFLRELLQITLRAVGKSQHGKQLGSSDRS